MIVMSGASQPTWLQAVTENQASLGEGILQSCLQRSGRLSSWGRLQPHGLQEAPSISHPPHTPTCGLTKH